MWSICVKGISMPVSMYSATNGIKSFAPRKEQIKQTLTPSEQIEKNVQKHIANKFEKEMQEIITKPQSERTLDEKIKLASYKTALGLMDMKNYPPVMY